MNLDTVPQEILERIAFISATDTVVGPPSALVTLLVTNREINARLSFASNQYLYARIFSSKFDAGPSSRRFTGHSTPAVLAHELVHRFRVLQRIRAKMDSAARPGSAGDGDSVHELLFHAYLMMLENAGKNEQQLRDYAKMGDWLRGYLFEERSPGRSRLTSHVEHWPPQNDHTSLAMWLFWFLLRPEDYTNDDDSTWNVLNVLKIYALGAHKYPLTDPSWVNFLPESPEHATHIVHYSEEHQFKTPPLATPAILSFLTLVNLKSKAIDFPSHIELPVKAESNEWECELGRCLSLSRPEFDNGLTESFRPGSVEGTWEGIFTYTEFTAYAALLQGAPPPILQKSVIVRHRQTWKLREHHFVVGTGATSSVPVHSRQGPDLGIDGDVGHDNPLSAGDPLRAYFPTGTHLIETRDGLEVRDPNRPTELRYRRAPGLTRGKGDEHGDDVPPPAQVQDIIITGEGHSAWGQFNLVGRVRPCDGFISLCKEYIDHDRGKWIYRGYLVGNINSNLAGRWRDTISPAAVPGYEGCFLMTRRR
ncbi:hypothetical protein B0H17DRAFT_306909 [Mycena rosella]|uniref:F-box domain-containing protein n=1 Tax=Mycena rosella TaxID=1033263 RepID=A0AAD7GQ68_MYCRO|nr:hypothetical protein B0H17DRAFT_306909 [Mycena rosella]